MVPLAILAVVAGAFEHSFIDMITKTLPVLDVHVNTTTFYTLIAVTTAIAVGGIVFAVMKFNKSGGYYGEQIKDNFFYKLLANQYYFPLMIDKLILKPYLALSKFSWKQIDIKIIDTIVDGIASSIYMSGEGSRKIQTGNLSKALKWMVIGIVILLVLVVIGTIK